MRTFYYTFYYNTECRQWKSSNVKSGGGGVKGSGPSLGSQTNLRFYNYICIYIRPRKVDLSLLILSLLCPLSSLPAGQKTPNIPLFNPHDVDFRATITQESCNECQKCFHQMF